MAEFLAEPLLQYDSPVSVAFDLTDARAASPAAVLFQMRYVMAEENLPLAVEEVHKSGAFHTVTEARIGAHRGGGGAKCRSARGYAWICRGLMQRRPAGWPVPGLHATGAPGHGTIAELTETPENRYVKYFLEECAHARRNGSRLICARQGKVGYGARSGELGSPS